MIPLEEALEHIRARVRPLGAERVPLAAALRCVLAEDVEAAWPVPPFDNSAVDGFAVAAPDTGPGPVELRIVGTVAAGDPGDLPVEPGTAVRITTGAPLPPGAASVAMVEDAVVDASGTTVRLDRPPPEGANVRRAGEDLRAGDPAVLAGTTLRPGHLGLLASVGLADVLVVRRPVVAIGSTGAELVEPGSPLGPGRIPDANRHLLLANCRAAGLTTVDLGRAGDDVDEVADLLRRGARSADVVLTSGGVSMGEFDPVKVALADTEGARWMQIAIKPAKPFAFGMVEGVPVLGLPGNPVSAAVSFELLVRPTISLLGGGGFRGGPIVEAVAGEDLARRRDGKVHYVRVRLEPGPDGRPVARSAGAQGSHQLTGLAGADGLAVVPDGDGLRVGDAVDVLVMPAD
ncbi:MAG: molybdopterin molybdotransferase MoeA [Acidobacteria bacterium]|nr:molybdopterin molybdotransferase MoeA [Acidobacteriota bacterium]